MSNRKRCNARGFGVTGGWRDRAVVDGSVLEHRFGGRDISEVLAMAVTEAEQFFSAGDTATPASHRILERLADVGLGHLTLGQPSAFVGR